MLDIYHDFRVDESIAHTHEQVGAAHKQARRLPVLLKKAGHLIEGPWPHVVETWKTRSCQHIIHLLAQYLTGKTVLVPK